MTPHPATWLRPWLAPLLIAASACSDTTIDFFDAGRGLLAYWAFDEAQAGSVAADGSGLGSTGTPSSVPPTPSNEVAPVGFFNPFSLSFGGKNQWLALGNPPILNAGGVITVAAWIRPLATDGFRNVIGHGFRRAPDQEVALRLGGDAYQFTYWNGIDHQASSPLPPSDVGRWVHLCGVFDGTRYLLYRNGTLAAQLDDATLPPPAIDAPWAIGARIPPADDDERRLFQGQIDEVRIYGRALSAGEVRALASR